jgi:hypothetical protein
MNSRVPISGLASPSRASLAMRACWAVNCATTCNPYLLLFAARLRRKPYEDNVAHDRCEFAECR